MSDIEQSHSDIGSPHIGIGTEGLVTDDPRSMQVRWVVTNIEGTVGESPGEPEDSPQKPELESDSGFNQLIQRISSYYQVTLNEKAIAMLKVVYDKDPNQKDGAIFWKAKLLAGKEHDVTALSSLDPEIQSAIAALRLLYNRHNNNK